MRRRVKQEHEAAKSDNKHVPKVAAPAKAEDKSAVKKKGVTIAKIRARKAAVKAEDKKD